MIGVWRRLEMIGDDWRLSEIGAVWRWLEMIGDDSQGTGRGTRRSAPGSLDEVSGGNRHGTWRSGQEHWQDRSPVARYLPRGDNPSNVLYKRVCGVRRRSQGFLQLPIRVHRPGRQAEVGV